MRHDWLPPERLPPRDEVDWNLWLGPCPWRPYNRSYVRGGWRGHYDFHTSCIGEWGAHTFAQAQLGLGCAETSPVEVVIYGIQGRVVRMLVQETKNPGRYEMVWDGRDDRGMSVGSGVYLCALRIGSYGAVKKMVLVK